MSVKRCLPAQLEEEFEIEADEQSTADGQSAMARNAASKNFFIVSTFSSLRLSSSLRD